MNIVAPFGFYGYGNIGDEATLQGFARLRAGIEALSEHWFSWEVSIDRTIQAINAPRVAA